MKREIMNNNPSTKPKEPATKPKEPSTKPGPTRREKPWNPPKHDPSTSPKPKN